MRFVFVRHPARGNLVLLTTDTTLDPLDVIALYGYRFKIEVGFRQAVQGMGTYFYQFWMRAMTPRKRGALIGRLIFCPSYKARSEGRGREDTGGRRGRRCGGAGQGLG